MLLEEYFTSGNHIAMDGPLYVKCDSKKTWKRHHFVLRASGLYYFQKEKTKSIKDLVCHGLFTDNDIYKGISWKKKHKAPTDFTFAMKSPKEQFGSKSLRSLKMLCAEDAETLDKWVTAIRLAKYGKQIFNNYRVLMDDLAREELEKFSSNRCGSIGSIISSVPSQCSTGSSGGGTINPALNGRLSRASSSSSSGCLSDENNGFDSEFPTGTIKRKPSMKPNLPLTSMTRQLKEVGETNFASEVGSNPTSPERGGTLTRRHSRRRSEESTGSGTLKRRPSNRGSIESMSSSASTPTPSAPGTPLGTMQPNVLSNNNHNNHHHQQQHHIVNNNHINVESKLNQNPLSPLEIMPACMTDSTFSLPPPPDDLGNNLLNGSQLSLDSLPPPPPPCELLTNDFSASQMSLVSLPPPPPDIRPSYIVSSPRTPTTTAAMHNATSIIGDIIHPVSHFIIQQQQTVCYATNNTNTLPAALPSTEWKREPQPIYSKTMKPAIKAPPYKSPPPYNNNNGSSTPTISGPIHLAAPPVPPSATKSVSFADSPVLLRRKVCFDDEVLVQQSPRKCSLTKDQMAVTAAPPPPPRAEATRLSVAGSSSSSSITSPKRLAESQSNPPRDFLKDLQRVMRKKWQVAQKCKLEPATTPHEVLGFRDFNGELTAIGQSSHYYRETSNVSNWVQEHYGGCDSLYENLGADMGVEPVASSMPQLMAIKKRPPPPPPKRSQTTQLTQRS